MSLARLLQLASPALPVGAYSYSQGLEAAIESGAVHDAASAQIWIADTLEYSIARFEASLWCRLHAAWSVGDAAAMTYWNDWFCASRETAELRAETLQMGWSLRRLCLDLGEFDADALAMLAGPKELAFPTAWAFAAVQWRITAHEALLAYLWSWLENQAMAALKTVPLGQTEAQRMLSRLGGRLEAAALAAEALEESGFANFTPGLAIASSVHETQYSRLFRS